MDSTHVTRPGTDPSEQERVVEMEIRLPRREDFKLPKIDAEPLRDAAEQAVLTGLGMTVLASRAVVKALRAANEAGAEAAENPGPLTRALLRAVGHAEPANEPKPLRSVRVLPIADYASLSTAEIIARLSELDREQLQVLRNYEAEHADRSSVLEAIDAQLASA